MSLKRIIYSLAMLVALTWRVEAQNNDTNFFPLLRCSNRTYTNATITVVNPVTVHVFWNDTDEKIPMTDLPPEIQNRYYDPQKAQKFLDEQEAIAAAKSTLGPPQTIQLVRVLPNGAVQIETEGRAAQACIHNLPVGMPAILREIHTTEAEIARIEADLAIERTASQGQAHPPVKTGASSQNLPSRASAQAKAKAAAARNAAADAARDATASREAAAAMLANDTAALAESKARLKKLKASCTIIARPTDFLVYGVIRQWEFQAMDNPVHPP